MKNLLVGAIITLAFFTLLFTYYRLETDKKNTELLNIELVELKRYLTNTDPASPEYRIILERIGQLQNPEKEQENIAENPAAFYEALAGLKTKKDGSTYELNYKTRQLERALIKRKGLSLSLNPVWTERGPYNINGRTRAIIVDQNDSSNNTWFVASVGGGIWKTIDSGQNWEPKGENFSSLSVTTLAQSGNTIYAGTGMGYGRILDLSGAGVWKSEDNGDTWFQLSSTDDGQLLQAINRIVVNPDNPDELLVCSNDSYSWNSPKGGERKSGIFRSVDGGESWSQTFDPDQVFGTSTDNRVQQIIANPDNFNTLFATVNEVGVIRSHDAGINWQLVGDNLINENTIGANQNTYSGVSQRIEIAMAPTDTNYIYASVERPSGYGQLYWSNNAGNSWINLQQEPPLRNWFSAYGQSGANAYSAGWFDNTIAVDPFYKYRVYLGGVELHEAIVNDFTESFTLELIGTNYETNLGIPYVHADHHFLVVIPYPLEGNSTNTKIVNANDGGIAVSEDMGINWTQLSGINSSQFYGIDKKPNESAYIGGMQDNSTAISTTDTDAFTPWTKVIGGDGVEAAWNKRDPNLMLAGAQYGVYFRSEDAGQSWYRIPEAKAGLSAPFISKIATSVQDPDLVFTVGSDGVKRSDDFGASWTLTRISNNWHGYRAFDNVEISIASPQIIWATSRIGIEPLSGTSGGVHVSIDGGLSFTDITSSIGFDVLEASGIATHPTDPETAYLLFAGPDQPKILKTTDLGQSWVDISGFGNNGSESDSGFPDVAVFSMVVMPFNTDILWAGTEIGIVTSEDGGNTWVYLDSDLPRVSIFDMKILDDEVVTGTYGRGVWTATLPELNGYKPIAATLSPRIDQLAMSPSGSLTAKISLRSEYDSTRVYLDDAYYKTIPANSEPEVIEEPIAVFADGTRTVYLESFKNDQIVKSPKKSTQAFVAEPQLSFITSGNNFLPGDFVQNGLFIGSQSPFSGQSIQSTHPYNVNQDYSATLKTPIIVAGDNAILSYDDVALIEPGEPGTEFGDPQFWDYVIVEATKDGVTWEPLADGYDARYSSSWLSAYQGGQSGVPIMLQNHQINLLDTFNPNDIILIRFRLSSDPAVTGWGWLINNLQIQPEGVTNLEPELSPSSFTLSQNYPNPFNPTTTIEYSLAKNSDVEIRVYNISGQLVQTLYNGYQTSGNHSLSWDAFELSSGVYFYSLKSGNQYLVQKATLIK